MRWSASATRLKATLIAIVLALSALLAACGRGEPVPEADPESRRSVQDGDVMGFVGQYGSHVWLGLRYAAPPVGERRWRAPQPPEPRTSVHKALTPGDPCPQLGHPFGVDSVDPGEPAGDEDCLYLNIHAPRMGPDEVPGGEDRLPVMVWLHGGGNTVGQGAAYDGGRLADRHRMVVVTVNYRLGPMGWFRHRALRTEETTPADRSGNFGTLDVIRALEWVRDNIGAFGGDPGNVTVFGESAGGRNVVTMLLSPLAEGLFHRAIIQSGGVDTTDPAEAEGFAGPDSAAHRNSSDEVLARLLIRDGRAADRAAARAAIADMSRAEIAAYLRDRSAAELLEAYEAPRPGQLIDMPQVFADGTVLPDGAPLEHLARRDGHNRVPVMLGSNRDEMKLFMYADPQWVGRFLWIIPRADDPQLYDVAGEYASRQWKATGVDQPAAALAAGQDQPVFGYRFDWDEAPEVLGADLSRLLGAAHAFEIPFVFGHWELGDAGDAIFTDDNRAGRDRLSARMMSYWAEFAHTGDPGRGRGRDLPQWPVWRADAPEYMVLDTDAGGGLRGESRTWTPQALVEAVADDPRLDTARQRCSVYWQMADFGRGFTREDYAAPDLGCGEFPFDAFPWRE